MKMETTSGFFTIPATQQKLKMKILNNKKDKNQRFFHCNFFPKNRKGFLLGSETLKIIIAVICIVFLIFLLFALYYSLTGQEKVKQAEASKEKISLEINRISTGGEPLEQGINVPNPSDWFIFSFVGEEKKPNLCTGKNCLCICEEVILDIFGLDWQIKRCDEKGACNLVSNLKKFERIKIERNGVDILIVKINGEIEIRKK